MAGVKPKFEKDTRQFMAHTDNKQASYATSSAYAPCGCRQTRLLEPEHDVWIEWVRCEKHYEPERDDAMVLLAADNKRERDSGLFPAAGRRAEGFHWLLRRVPPKPKRRAGGGRR